MKRQCSGMTSFKYSYFLLIGAILLSGCNDSANDNSNTPDTGKKTCDALCSINLNNKKNLIMITRRKFLNYSLNMGFGAAALAAFPSSIQKALAIPANNKTGTIQDVEHVIILMQENRSFDHYFGTLKRRSRVC